MLEKLKNKKSMVLLLLILVVIILFSCTNNVSAQQGCCSWHGGVSGCSNGQVLCNDGTLSPSCTCGDSYSYSDDSSSSDNSSSDDDIGGTIYFIVIMFIIFGPIIYIYVQVIKEDRKK